MGVSFTRKVVSNVLYGVLIYTTILVTVYTGSVAKGLLTDFFIVVLFMANNFRRYITGVCCVATKLLTRYGPRCIRLTGRTCKFDRRCLKALGMRGCFIGGLLPMAVNGVVNNTFYINIPMCCLGFSGGGSGRVG